MKTLSSSLLRHQPKMDDVCLQIEQLAHKLGPSAKLPTISQLKIDLQASRDTLHRALGELERKDVILRVHGNGIFVSPRLHSKTIGAIYAASQTNNSPFWDLLVNQMRQRAARGHENFQIYLASPTDNGAELTSELIKMVREKKIQGIVCIGHLTDRAIEWLAEQDIPTVTFASAFGSHLVAINTTLVPQLGVRELSLQGCRRIGLWMPFGHWERAHRERKKSLSLKAFQKSLSQCGKTFEAAWSWRVDEPEQEPSRESFQEQGYRAVLETFSEKTKKSLPDGLVITNDLMTRGALDAFHKLDLRVGVDVKIATHHTTGLMLFLGYEELLTRIEVDPAEIVSTIFAVLENLMNGETSPSVTNIDPVVKLPL